MKQYNIPRPLIRISAFVLKELAAILRQPRLIFTLILGPFLILLIFGIGYRTNNRTLKTVFVAPEQGRVRELVDKYGESLGQQIEFVGVTTDEAEASASLQSQAVDLVVVTPTDPLGNLRASKQSVFQLYHYEIDPCTSLLQSVMLRGQIPSLLQLGGLYAIAILLFIVSWWRLGRLMARE